MWIQHKDSSQTPLQALLRDWLTVTSSSCAACDSHVSLTSCKAKPTEDQVFCYTLFSTSARWFILFLWARGVCVRYFLWNRKWAFEVLSVFCTQISRWEDTFLCLHMPAHSPIVVSQWVTIERPYKERSHNDERCCCSILSITTFIIWSSSFFFSLNLRLCCPCNFIPFWSSNGVRICCEARQLDLLTHLKCNVTIYHWYC